MRALVLEKFNGPFVPKDVPTPAIAPHEALVRVRNVGVCGTDVKIRADRMGLGVIPLIMGHEIAGEVAEVGGEVRGFAPGDRVVVNFYITCGRCQFCRVGRDTLCPEVRQHGFSIDGGFAEYVKTPGVNLCKVPDHVSLEAACILGDAVATSYHAITKRAQVRPGTTLALIGVGGVGLHALQMARLAGGWVIAVDVNDARLELARSLGADAVVDARSGPFHEAIRKLTGGQGVDVVLEFVANAQTLPSSYQSVKRAGRLVFVGYTPGLPLPVMPHELVRNELEIVGSRANSKQELAETMELVARGRIKPIVDRVIPLADIEDAFTALREGRPLGPQRAGDLAPHPALSPEGRGCNADPLSAERRGWNADPLPQGERVQRGSPLPSGERVRVRGQAVRPLAVPTAVFSPCWFWHHTSTTTRVPAPSGRVSFTTPCTVSRSPAYTGLMNAIESVPPLTKPAPRRRVIISET